MITLLKQTKSFAFTATIMTFFLFTMAAAQSFEDAAVNFSKSETIRAIQKMMIADYIWEDTANEVAKMLGDNLSKGKYDHLKTAKDFANALTTDLQAITSDKHLRVYSAVEEKKRKQPKAGGKSMAERRAARMKQINATPVITTEMKPDNIGYVKVNHFMGNMAAGEEAGFSEQLGDRKDEMTQAMKKLEGANALIIDVRNNPGGVPGPVIWLSSFLFAEKTHLASTERPREGMHEERWTRDDVDVPIFGADVPVYVLTNGKTFSAGESFTFGLQVTGRATLVGEPTGGGGHFGSGFTMINDQFSMFLPVGRTFHPITGKGWEATGIKPDVEVEADKALDVAIDLILDKRS